MRNAPIADGSWTCFGVCFRVNSRRIPFTARLTVAVQGITMRKGEYLEGEAGWGEVSPLPSWSIHEQQMARRFAIEAATEAFPEPIRDRVEVNAMVPRLAPEAAARLAAASGCRTIKVKVGDAADLDRVTAIREAVGKKTKIRLDANCAWETVDAAIDGIKKFQHLGIELVEDPIGTLEELAWVRSEVEIPVASEMHVRTFDDVQTLVDLKAADALVLKPQRFGGIRPCLKAAEMFDGPVIASSALETSVGLAAVVALAAALPQDRFAHGVGTALLLRDDPSEARLAPIGGWITPRRISPALELLQSKRRSW
jgi:o-succinylbenzoate synthase